MNSIRIKHFKDSIVGLKAILNYFNSDIAFNGKSGTIKSGNGNNRFSFALDDKVTINNKIISTVPLSEYDEIILMVDKDT